MRIRVLAVAFLSLSMAMTFSQRSRAQQAAAPPPLTEEEQKAKADREKKAVELLEQVISEAQSMRLPENRVRVQISAGDLLWDRDESRARTLFSDASAGIIDQMRSLDINDRQYSNLLRAPSQQRQELVLTVARHESALAYQILAATRPPTPPPPSPGPRTGGPGPTPQDADANLERTLLAQIAATDPKLALQNAEDLLTKGQYSSAMASVLAQLQQKDKESATKFQEKLLRKLMSENLLASPGATSLVMALLRPGPRLEGTTSTPNASSAGAINSSSALGLAAYRDLLETVIAAAFKATPAARGNQGNGQGDGRGQDNPRAVQPNNPGTAQNRAQVPQTQSSTQTSAQTEQNSARGLLGSLQSLLTQIDQYLPARSQVVRQKMTELGMNNDQQRSGGQFGNLLQQGSADSILSAAATASPQVQPRLYQQAALKALEEGNLDRARQIANEHLEPSLRASVLQSVDLAAMARAGTLEKIDEIRQTVSRLRTDDERIRVLLQLASGVVKQNPKLALDLLEQARNLVARRPANYQQFDAQLRVARAFAPLDPARTLEVLETGITQLNDLLPAAATLSGFEVNIFKDGELPLQGGSQLTVTLTRYAQQIAVLARNNVDLAVTGADKFQLTESRILVRLSIVRAALGIEAPPNLDGGAAFGGGRDVLQTFPPSDRRQL